MLSNAKYIAILIVTLLTINVSRAQLKHDANWVFGDRCGISFLNPNSPEVFLSSCDRNFEQNGSISNENGSLLFYFSDYKGLGSFLGDHAFLLDHNNQPLLFGDTIKANYTMTPPLARECSIAKA